MSVRDSRERSERPVRPEGNRNRRMFASIQSTLGGPPVRTGPRTRLQAKREQEIEKLDGLDDIITQIADLSIRSDRSAIQIKRNIRGCQYLDHMTEAEWETLCKTLCETAMQQSETDFVVDLFGSLLEHTLFCEVICGELARLSAVYIMEGGEDSIPSFLGSILCGAWPRGATRAIDSSNPILFTTVNIIKGWLIVINGSHDGHKQKETVSQKPDDDDSGSISSLESTSHDEAEEEEEKASPLIVNRCAVAVSDLCASTQRSLWMKWPTLCDEIYAAIKPAITHNSDINGDVKSALLSTMISLHMWTRAKAVTTTCTSTQTSTE